MPSLASFTPVTQELACWIYECRLNPDVRRSINLNAIRSDQSFLANLNGLDDIDSHEGLQDLLQNYSNKMARLKDDVYQLSKDIDRLSDNVAYSPNVSHENYVSEAERYLDKVNLGFLATVSQIDVCKNTLAMPNFYDWKFECSPMYKQYHNEIVDLFHELLALEREFKGVDWQGGVQVQLDCTDRKGNFSVITTKRVRFTDDEYDVDLGRFEIVFPSGQHNNENKNWPRIIAIDPNYATNEYGEETEYPHPNVDGSGICMGSGLTALEKAMESHRYCDAAMLVNAVLFNEHSESPYWRLDRWNGEGGIECADCNHFSAPDETIYCECCGSQYCFNCSFTCYYCNQSTCYSDQYECDSCSSEEEPYQICNKSICIEKHLERVHPEPEEEEEEESIYADGLKITVGVFGSPMKTSNELEAEKIQEEYQPITEEA